MLGPSVRTCYFLIQPDTGLSLFTLNLCCRLFAMIRTSYTTGTIALLWHGSTLKDLTKELPGGMCSLEFSRWEAWQKYLQWKNHDKFSFFPLPCHSGLHSCHSFLPSVFPWPGWVTFSSPACPLSLPESASLRESLLAAGEAAISVFSCLFILMVSSLSAPPL